MDEGTNLDWIFRIVVNIIIATSQEFELANTIFQQKFMWISLFLALGNIMVVHSAPINNALGPQEGGNQLDLIKFVDNGMENSTFTTYRTKQFNIETFETKLVEVVDTLTNAVDTNCAMIPLWKQVCSDDEPTCQLT